MKKALLLSLLLLPVFAGRTFAVEVDSPSCLTPNGRVIADYATGDHGIVGQGNKIGADKVYSLETGALQCFCGEDGHGIQTNWLNASNLSQDQIKIYESQGWIYVPTGASWGLSDDPYIAKNADYTCHSTTGGGEGQRPNNPTDGKSDGRTDGAGSIVQAAKGSLASTGNTLFIIQVFLAGVLLTATGVILNKRSK